MKHVANIRKCCFYTENIVVLAELFFDLIIMQFAPVSLTHLSYRRYCVEMSACLPAMMVPGVIRDAVWSWG
jgi:hypothetical protein